MESRVLIIDDDAKLQKLLKKYLESYGCIILSLMSGADALSTIEKELPDIIILDIVLPETDGLSILSDIRKSYTTPVIMLSAKGDETDRIIGLEMGADDYLPKPFNPRELLARMKAVLRRQEGRKASTGTGDKKSSIVMAGGMELDRLKQALVNVDNRPGEENMVELTSTEYGIIEALMTRPNTVFTRDELMNHARGNDFSAFDRSIDMHISNLRSKIKMLTGEDNRIKTVWGTGYMFVDEL